ncbi:Uncharacterised protein [Vibrio cholerae]|nr:Uncharacterised protein [Vibrio cholerae]
MKYMELKDVHLYSIHNVLIIFTKTHMRKLHSDF